MESKDLTLLTDEEIVAQAQKGDMLAYEFLIDKYKSLAKAKSRMYFIAGGDHDDVIQEGMIGIFKAIHDFDMEKNTSFKTFVELCVTRQIITAIQKATRQKHQILNESLSLNAGDTDENEDYRDNLMDAVSHDDSPEKQLMMKEVVRFLKENEKEIFSPMEIQVWDKVLKGKDYKEIAEELGKEPKNIDNALQRIKKKLKSYLV